MLVQQMKALCKRTLIEGFFFYRTKYLGLLLQDHFIVVQLLVTVRFCKELILTENISMKSEMSSERTNPTVKYDENVISIPAFETKYCRELSLARNINDFYMHIGITLRYMGFSEYSFSRLSATAEIPVPLVTMPIEMNNIYFTDAHFECDPVIQYVLANDAPIFLSDIKSSIASHPYETELIKRNKEMFALLSSYSYYDFYFIPIGASNGEGTVMLAVATKSRDINQFHHLVESLKFRLLALTRAIDFVGTKKFPAFFLSKGESKKILIDSGPLELLRVMVQEDVKLFEAAKRMNVSRHTANRWMKCIRNDLQASTTARAIYLALKAGLIDEK